MPSSSILRSPVAFALLTAVIALTIGCYEEVALQPADQPETTTPAVDAPAADLPVVDSQAVDSQVIDPPADSTPDLAPAGSPELLAPVDQLTPVADDPLEPAGDSTAAPAIEALPPVDLEAPADLSDDIFGGPLETAASPPAADTPSETPALETPLDTPPVETPSETPLDNDAPAEASSIFAPAATDNATAAEPAADTPGADTQPPSLDDLFAPPKDGANITADQPAPADVPAAMETAPLETAPLEPATEPTDEAPTSSPPVTDGPPPLSVSARNSRLVAWLLASKLSFALLAPVDAGERQRLLDEVNKLAGPLDVTLPTIGVSLTPAEVLAVGRKLGDQVAASSGLDHAALIEVAFKTNLLLAVYAKQPELVHPIVGAVAAACTRAGVPDAVWQSWQQKVLSAAGEADLHAATTTLHAAIEQQISGSSR